MTIRYLHVIHSIDPKDGGPVEGVRTLTAAAARLNYGVEVATLHPPRPHDVAHFECPIHYVGPSYLKYGYAPNFARWLKSNAERFSAIIVNGIWQYQSYCTWRVLRDSPTPYYVFPHGMLDPWFKRKYPLKHLKKLLYWPFAEYRVLRDARAVLFTCDEERQLARQSFGRYKVTERVVSYGVPVPDGDRGIQVERFLARFPELIDKRLLLFMGRIHPKKGCDLLIRAFASMQRQYPNAHLVLAGPDQVGWQAELEVLCRRLHISSSVTWTGMLREELKMGALHAAEALVLPSHQENFGVVVAEALSCSLPVLISDKVNIWREILEDHAGLVADDTLEGTTRVLQDWFSMSDAGRARMASNALMCFKARYHGDAAARCMLEAIELTVSQRVA
jgi:glycosyltransferase involved in cell wall biosynthesis